MLGSSDGSGVMYKGYGHMRRDGSGWGTHGAPDPPDGAGGIRTTRGDGWGHGWGVDVSYGWGYGSTYCRGSIGVPAGHGVGSGDVKALLAYVKALVE